MTTARPTGTRRSPRETVLATAPALVVVGVAAFVLDNLVWWLEGRWLLLLLAGIVGINLALVLPEPPEPPERPARPRPVSEPPRPDRGPTPERTRVELELEVAVDRSAGATRPAAGLRVESLRIPKPGAMAGECEDAFAGREETAAYAVADGASSSFDAGAWAQLLADRFVADPDAALSRRHIAAWLARTRELWRERLAETASATDAAWWEERPREQGAFATVLGIRIVDDGWTRRWEAVTVGDSCLVQVRAGKVVGSFPADPSTTFGRYPLLLASTDDAADELARFRWAAGHLDPDDTLLLMTDAIADWLLAGAADTARLLGEAHWPDVRRRLVAAREQRDIAADDLTLLRIRGC